MTPIDPFLGPSEAANSLGVSAKALRLYEQRGLLTPLRTAAGWRAYGPEQIARAHQITALRKFGLGLADVARVLQGDPARLEAILASRQAALEREIAATVATVGHIRAARADLAEGRVPAAEALSGLVVPAAVDLSFALPWPWGGETFKLRGLAPVTYLVGPLGSGKTKLARSIADNLEDAHYLSLERLTDGHAQARLNEDPSLASRVEAEMARFVGTGASRSAALTALIVALEAPEAETLVVDMVEQGLDGATQKAVAAKIRRRAGDHGNHPGTRLV